MKSRRGHSLVECLISVGLIGAVMSTVAVAMHGMRRSCRTVREESTSQLELGRFAAQLRTDAHRALSVNRKGSVDPSVAADVVSFALAAEVSVEYTLQATQIERLLRTGGEIRHRETYRMPISCTAGWQVQTDRASPLVSLILQPASTQPGGPLGFQTIQIDAAVGLLPPPPPRDES